MIKLFKPEDFNVWVNDHPYYKSGDPLLLDERIAKAANQILQREVEKWPVVFFAYDGKDPIDIAIENVRFDTHTARLAFIEEIKKEECKHEPEHIFIGPETGNWSTICKHCGVKLVAEWKEA